MTEKELEEMKKQAALAAAEMKDAVKKKSKIARIRRWKAMQLRCRIEV
jgi:hypothetical protein